MHLKKIREKIQKTIKNYPLLRKFPINSLFSFPLDTKWLNYNSYTFQNLVKYFNEEGRQMLVFLKINFSEKQYKWIIK